MYKNELESLNNQDKALTEEINKLNKEREGIRKKIILKNLINRIRDSGAVRYG